jgi:hypothetical protein
MQHFQKNVVKGSAWSEIQTYVSCDLLAVMAIDYHL